MWTATVLDLSFGLSLQQGVTEDLLSNETEVIWSLRKGNTHSVFLLHHSKCPAVQRLRLVSVQASCMVAISDVDARFLHQIHGCIWPLNIGPLSDVFYTFTYLDVSHHLSKLISLGRICDCWWLMPCIA